MFNAEIPWANRIRWYGSTRGCDWIMVRFPRNKVSRTATMNRPQMPWDTEPNCPNPKGIAPQRPGLRGLPRSTWLATFHVRKSYPGYGWKKINYPEGVAPSLRPEPRVPFVRRRAFEVHGEVGVLVLPFEIDGKARLATLHLLGPVALHSSTGFQLLPTPFDL